MAFSQYVNTKTTPAQVLFRIEVWVPALWQFVNGFQAPSEIDFGELLRRFLKHFQQFFEGRRQWA